MAHTLLVAKQRFGTTHERTTFGRQEKKRQLPLIELI